jgi:type III pantothenate kinase
MLLVIDIGNTNVVWGIFEDATLVAHWRLATDPKTTSDEYGVLCMNLLARSGRTPQQVTDAIISSVVPALTGTFETMVETYFHRTPLIVSSEMDVGLTLKYANPREIGSDRIVNAAAAYHKYKTDLIIVDFGTATTFCAVTQTGDYLGGVIAPGLGISAEALFARAAKLSNAGLVDALVRRMEQELGRTCLVIATGGLASVIAPETTTIKRIEPLLTLEGLELLYRRARGTSSSTWA